jgi:CubicO group peptidase (beta-lactamase class C family)
MRSLLLASLAVIGAVLAPSAVAAPKHEAAIRAAVEALRLEAAVPAIGLGVIDRGEIVFLGGFGEVAGRPANERDRFRAASVSKLFTAQAVMRLVQQRRLGLDDDVGRWLPAFAGRGLTVRHLLTHRSGFRDAIPPQETGDASRVDAYLAILAAQPTARAPGVAYAYTDADFNVLGAIVTAASRQPFTAYVQQTLLAPLRMDDSAIFPTPTAREGIASPFLNRPTAAPRPRGPTTSPSPPARAWRPASATSPAGPRPPWAATAGCCAPPAMRPCSPPRPTPAGPAGSRAWAGSSATRAADGSPSTRALCGATTPWSSPGRPRPGRW